MSEQQVPTIDIDQILNRRPGEQPGDINDLEKWWVDRQVALEQAGYLLRSRYRPGWKPSWANTNKFYLDCDDGQTIGVSNSYTYAYGWLY
jgi:hypothetical protein